MQGKTYHNCRPYCYIDETLVALHPQHDPTVSKGHSWGTGGWSAPVLERFAAWMQSKDRSYTTSKLLPRTFHVDICEQWQKKLVTFHSTGLLIRILLVDIDHVDMLTMLAWWGQSDLWSNSVEIFAVAGRVKSWAAQFWQGLSRANHRNGG